MSVLPEVPQEEFDCWKAIEGLVDLKRQIEASKETVINQFKEQIESIKANAERLDVNLEGLQAKVDELEAGYQSVYDLAQHQFEVKIRQSSGN